MILEANSQVLNVKSAALRDDFSINSSFHELYGKWLRLVETKCLRDHYIQFQVTESPISWYESEHHSQLRCDHHHFWKNMIPSAHKPHQTVVFSGCEGSSWTCSGFSSSQIRQFSYWRNHWARNAPHRWTKFCSKTADLLQYFQEPNQQNSDVQEGHLVSFLYELYFVCF